MREQERQFETVRRNYTEEELRVMNEGLVVAVGEVRTLRADKAAAMTTLGAAIKQAEATVFDLQGKLSQGYESIDVEVVYVLDEPTPGQKKVVRADTSETLRIEAMTQREKQASFGFQEPE